MDSVQLATFSPKCSQNVSGHSVRRYGNAFATRPFGDFGKVSIGKKLKKAARGTVRFVGKVADSKITKGILAAGLMATGVGAGASAAIMAGTGAVGGGFKKGGSLKKALKGGATGAAIGAGAGLAGKVLPKVPGIGKQVVSMRQKIGTAKKPKSYDSDSRLDALAPGPLPAVSVLPSSGGGPPVIRGRPFVRPVESPEAIAAKKLARISMSRNAQKVDADANELEHEAAVDRRKGFDWNAKRKLAEAAAKRAAARAGMMAAETAEEPSANAAVPQGGFPAEVATDDPTAIPAKAGIGEMFKNPLVLGGVVLAVLMFSRKR
jgi:hypothetical protein